MVAETEGLRDPASARENGESDDASTNCQRSANYRQLAPIYVRQGYPAPIPLAAGAEVTAAQRLHGTLQRATANSRADSGMVRNTRQ